MSRNRVIGRGGSLPWRMPADLRRFRERTTGHAVIMGRKTWETLNGRPLPQRANIVLTRDDAFNDPGAIAAGSLDEALRLAQRARPEASEVFIAGGAEIYRLALPRAERIDLTLIDTEIADGDAFFPAFEHDRAWRVVNDQPQPPDEHHAHAYRFMTYERSR